MNLTANAKVFATEATTLVLAETPQGFPGNSGALLRADRWLLKADIDLAVAHFDRNVIDLFIDGYGVNSSTFASVFSRFRRAKARGNQTESSAPPCGPIGPAGAGRLSRL